MVRSGAVWAALPLLFYGSDGAAIRLARDGGGPTEQDRSEGMPSLSEAPNVRGKALWLLCAGPRRLFDSHPP
ncbi:hypothetical protein EMIT0P4_260014 [Pseudomonas sp. IT-P4]